MYQPPGAPALSGSSRSRGPLDPESALAGHFKNSSSNPTGGGGASERNESITTTRRRQRGAAAGPRPRPRPQQREPAAAGPREAKPCSARCCCSFKIRLHSAPGTVKSKEQLDWVGRLAAALGAFRGALLGGRSRGDVFQAVYAKHMAALPRRRHPPLRHAPEADAAAESLGVWPGGQRGWGRNRGRRCRRPMAAPAAGLRGVRGQVDDLIAGVGARRRRVLLLLHDEMKCRARRRPAPIHTPRPMTQP